jgi:hypothetical protein
MYSHYSATYLNEFCPAGSVARSSCSIHYIAVTIARFITQATSMRGYVVAMYIYVLCMQLVSDLSHDRKWSKTFSPNCGFQVPNWRNVKQLQSRATFVWTTYNLINRVSSINQRYHFRSVTPSKRPKLPFRRFAHNKRQL